MKKILFILLFIFFTTPISAAYRMGSEGVEFGSGTTLTLGFEANKKRNKVVLPAVENTGTTIILYDETCSQKGTTLNVLPPVGVRFFKNGRAATSITVKGKCHVLTFLVINQKYYSLI